MTRPSPTTKFVKWLVAGVTVLSLSAPFVARGAPVAAQPPGLVVSVAASLHAALAEIAGLYRAATGVTVSLNTGGSNTLARQIVAGARAAVFVSADEAQMDVVEKAGRVVAGTRTPLVTNELAVVAPKDRLTPVSLTEFLAGGVARLAIGETNSVPAGVYGRRWLEHEGAWARLQPKVIPFPTVRAVLAAVEAGRVDAGIVYATDARDAAVRVVGRVSAQEHAYLNIVQPAAVIAGPDEAAGRRFLQFLQGPAARAVFARRGFGTFE
ncbi:MAG: molybdate ABC transporter substrate-binding protein [Acidobacteriota bacterium]|nr:molybdate ABC transporter substrate-binding protein [Acidobacteriota bacterium]